jgi:hypothetical protein
MKNNNFRLFLLTLSLLLIAAIFNFNIYRELKKQRDINEKIHDKYKKISENKVKKYTYSDIIEFVERNKDFSIVYISKEKNNDINVELAFKGSFKSFTDSINSIINQGEFRKIAHLSLQNDNKNINDIIGRLKLIL